MKVHVAWCVHVAKRITEWTNELAEHSKVVLRKPGSSTNRTRSEATVNIYQDSQPHALVYVFKAAHEMQINHCANARTR